MPALFLQILSYISLAAQAAKDAKPIYDEGRAIIASWFKAGLITKEQQGAAFSWSEQHQADTLAGKVPVEFTVEPDPAPVVLQLPPGSTIEIPKSVDSLTPATGTVTTITTEAKP